MNLINYNNILHSVIYKKTKDKVTASIAVNGATATGKTEQEAYDNLKQKLNEMIKNNYGKERFLFD